MLRGGGSPIEVDALTDPLVDYVDMELKQIFFRVDADTRAAAPEQPLPQALVREPMLALPKWSHAQRPALNKIFAELRSMMEKEKLGFVV